MIEKLERHTRIEKGLTQDIKISCPPEQADIVSKINELVDAINKHEDIIKQIGEWGSSKGECLWCETLTEVHLNDPYAEQRRWIGRLCRFWDEDAFVTSNDWAFGILTGIDKGMQYQYCCNENCNFKHCEPVKSDDDIIYKGGDNG